MIAGNCWMMCRPSSGPKAHLWLLVSNPQPDNKAVMVSITTLRHNADQTVILQPGDHSFIRHPSCVFFADSLLIDIIDLARWIDGGIAQPKSDFSQAILKVIQEGLLVSDFTPKKIVDFCRACWNK